MARKRVARSAGLKAKAALVDQLLKNRAGFHVATTKLRARLYRVTRE